MNEGGCQTTLGGLLAVVIVTALIIGAVVASRAMYDSEQARATVARAESEARQVEAHEETQRHEATLRAEAEARRDFYVALAHYQDRSNGAALVLAAILGAIAGIVIVRWLQRLEVLL